MSSSAATTSPTSRTFPRSPFAVDAAQTGCALSGSLLPRQATIDGGTRCVTGIWFGSSACSPGHPLCGLHGELQVEKDGRFHYHACRGPVTWHAAARGPVEEAFILNLSDSAGASCSGVLSIAIEATPEGLRLRAGFRIESTVTERYCLTASNGLALLCMETAEHFEMCRPDTPLSAVARSHTREFFGVSGQHLLRIDPINGNTIWIGILAQRRRIVALDAAPDGLLYGVDVQGDLYRIQPATGASALLVRLGLPSLSRGAVTHMDGRIHWTAADNRLHSYDLLSGEHAVALESMPLLSSRSVHDRVLAMMPAMDGALFLATAHGMVRLDIATGRWTDLGLRGRLGELMGPGVPPGPQWGGREPGRAATEEPLPTWQSPLATVPAH